VYNACTAREANVGDYSSLTIEELVRRCSASGEIGAWEEFVRRFHRLIAMVALRTADRLGDSSAQTVDDLIQETYLKLCADDFRLLRNFEERHPDAFLGFVKVVTANVVRDYFKLSHSQRRGANRLQGEPEHFDPIAGRDNAGSPRSIERAVLIQEIGQYLGESVAANTERDRNIRIFWLYYRAGLSAAAIAALPEIGLTTKGVESIISRITKELRLRINVARPQACDQNRKTPEGILPAESF
jgi:RNA polymerase sigma-70 factor (ECF subfamily)